MKRTDITRNGILALLLVFMLSSCSSMDSSVINYQYQSVRWSFCVPECWQPEKKEELFLDLHRGDDTMIVLTEISLQKPDSSRDEYAAEAKKRHRKTFLEDGGYSLVEEKIFESPKWNGVMLISRDSNDGRFWLHYFLSHHCFNMMMLVISDECNAEVFSMIEKLISSINIESPEIILTSDRKTVHFETESEGNWSIATPGESNFAIVGNRFEIYLENNLALMNHLKDMKNTTGNHDERYQTLRDKLVEKFNLKAYKPNDPGKDIEMFFEGDFRHPTAVYWLRRVNNGIVVSFAIKTNENNNELSFDDIDVAGEIISSIKKGETKKVPPGE